MQKSHLEAKVLSLIDAVLHGGKVEDTTIELKAEWPDPVKAARRLAGHANAARMQSVVWIIGIDEKQPAIVAVEPKELANWWASVESNFDQVVPRLATTCTVHHESGNVVALYFECDQPPYVVKNPNGGAIGFEVPWRTATSVRSASRNDLLRMLYPVTKLPVVDVISGELERSTPRGEEFWRVNTTIFLVPQGTSVVYFPDHQCRGELTVSTPDEGAQFRLNVEFVDEGPQLTVDKPGKFRIRATGTRSALNFDVVNASITATIQLPVAGDPSSLLSIDLQFGHHKKADRGSSQHVRMVDVWRLR